MAANMRRLFSRTCASVYSGLRSFARRSFVVRVNSLSSTEDKEKGDVRNEDFTTAEAEKIEPLSHPDYFNVKGMFTLREMFDAGVHLGHHEGCWDPLMRPYLYGTLHHHHIIDLNKSLVHLQIACNALAHIAYRNGIILFVNTHPKFEKITQMTARDCGEYFVSRKWRGGTLTNMQMILGVTALPHCVVFLHQPTLGRNLLAVKEAAMMNIPSIGIVDSDCDPRLIMYPIPGNDDTPRTMEFYCGVFKKTILSAKERRELDMK